MTAGLPEPPFAGEPDAVAAAALRAMDARNPGGLRAGYLALGHVGDPRVAAIRSATAARLGVPERAVPSRVQWTPCRSPFVSASRPVLRVTSTWAEPAPRCSTGPSRGNTVASSSSGSRTPTAERSTEESLEAILDALRWLGLDWDEGPPTAGYRQTERNDIYRAHADRLLAEGKAYRCRCTPETLDSLRTAAQARGRDLPLSRHAAATPPCPPASRTRCACACRTPAQTVVEDVLHGTVVFDHTQLDDWIIVRTRRHADLQLLRGGRRRDDEDHPRDPGRRPPVEHAEAGRSAIRRSATRRPSSRISR